MINIQASLIDDLDITSNETSTTQLSKEKIINISSSRKIYLLSNQNTSYSNGDFISFLINKTLVARGLVAKNTKDVSAIKIVKIYSNNLFKSLKKNIHIQIIKGDDSYYKESRKKKRKSLEIKIEGEDDLFDETNILSEDINNFDGKNKNNIIKNDNILSVGIGVLSQYNERVKQTSSQQFHFSWGYQINKNIFIEGLYGQSIIKDYPSIGLDSSIKNYTLKIKYALSAPFYSIIFPYVGLQLLKAQSPGAGVSSTSKSDTEELAEELQKLEELNAKRVIFGVNILKRLVPGWFLNIHFGNELASIGLALEF